jgi:S-DNA-T family DNA segregation ATPase FtsK/SpoIIIE
MLGDETVKEKLTQNIELKKKPEDTEVVKIKDSQIKEKLSLPTPPVEFLTDTSILNSQLIETEAKTLLERLITFLNSKNISITSTNINVMPLFKEISFKTKNVKDSDAIIRLQREICKAMSVTECNINFKDTFISFEIPNVNKEKISISNLMEKVKGTKNTSVIGIDNNHTPLNLNYNNSHINLIIGKIGGGGNMLLSVLITSFAYLNSVNEGEIVIFNVLEKNLTIFKDLPHLIEPIVMQENTYTKFKELKQHLESRIEKLSIFKYVDAYNKSNSDKKIKNLLIVIPNIDFLINSNSEYLLLIDELISLVKKADASIIFTMHGINGEFVNLPNYKNINSKFIFKLGTEYESLLLFDNYRGLQLYGNGDGFAFLNSNNKIRFQSCYINQSEIKNTVDTLNRFYLEKLK